MMSLERCLLRRAGLAPLALNLPIAAGADPLHVEVVIGIVPVPVIGANEAPTVAPLSWIKAASLARLGTDKAAGPERLVYRRTRAIFGCRVRALSVLTQVLTAALLLFRGCIRVVGERLVRLRSLALAVRIGDGLSLCPRLSPPLGAVLAESVPVLLIPASLRFLLACYLFWCHLRAGWVSHRCLPDRCVVYIDQHGEASKRFLVGPATENVIPRPDVIASAERARDLGCIVAVSEREPLPIPGFHHHRLGKPHGRGRTFGATEEWLTLSAPPVGVLPFAVAGGAR